MSSPTASIEIEKASPKDPEKGLPIEDETRVHHVEIEHPTAGFAGKLWDIVVKMGNYGVEVRGIERVKPQDRSNQSAWDACWMWLAANCTISTFSLGTLGPSTFDLGLRDSALTIIFFNLLSTLPVAYFSTWGPKLGLRQMTLSRFSFGYYTVQIPVVLNIIACIGWSTINSIIGGQTLRAVSTSHQIPEWAAIVVIAVLTVTVSLFGYKHIHFYERYSWYVAALIFIILLGLSAKHMVSTPFAGSGPVEAGNVLSYGAAIVGFGLGWSSLAADYTVNMKEDSNTYKVFFLTYLGLNLPLILIEVLGAAMTTVDVPEWQAAYASGGIGGLMGAGLSPAGGFGKFLLVLLALSIVANNIPNIYSLALTSQVLGKHVQAIPRAFLVLIATVAYVILAIVGASHFEEWLDTLLVLLSYWLAIYSTILIEEHLIFRKGKWSNYDPEAYTEASKLPLGIAAFLALGFGVMGAVLGMAQVWYVGILGRKIGDPVYGGDIGFELSMGFSGVVYPIFRYYEKKYEKKLGRPSADS